jgi:hypothetical protein
LENKITGESNLKPLPDRRTGQPTPKLQRQLERLSRLPKAKQKFVSEMLDTVLQQAGS